MAADIRITKADNKFHCKEFIDAEVNGIQMNAEGQVKANGINEIASKITRFRSTGALETPELIEDNLTRLG